MREENQLDIRYRIIIIMMDGSTYIGLFPLEGRGLVLVEKEEAAKREVRKDMIEMRR